MSDQKESQIALELVSRITAGDSSAEAQMVERYDRGLRFMLKRRANSRAIAEDIAQETWRIVIEKVRNQELKNPAALAAFIVQIGKNQLLMHYRSKHNSKTLTNMEITELEDQAKTPQEILEQHNLAMMVRGLIAELRTERDKQIITRFYLDEESKSSICKSFSINELHFNRVLFRARQRFKQIMEEYLKVAI